MHMGALDTIRQIGKNAKVRDKCVVDDSIAKSPYDRTFVGVVVDRVICSAIMGISSEDSGDLIQRWVVAAGGRMFEIEPKDCNITGIGQRVRVYLPSNAPNCIYAEVINPATTPDEAVFVENDKRYDRYKTYGIDESKGIDSTNCNEKIVIDSITEKWALPTPSDRVPQEEGETVSSTAPEFLRRIYLLTVFNAGKEEEEVTNIICPDGKIMKLEGFFVNRWTHSISTDTDDTDDDNDDSNDNGEGENNE